MTVILVEDEPSALRYLRSSIQLHCKEWRIVAAAENGAEGMKQARLLRPDLVITDIRMPLMDGIELVGRLKEELPEVSSIIVSGYQDFEYARGALRSGVVEYLLKPVRASELKRALEAIAGKVRRDTYNRRVRILENAVLGLPMEEGMAAKYLPFQKFEGAVLRMGGLLSRFRAAPGGQDEEAALVPPWDELLPDNVWAFSGRDTRELVFFHAPELTRTAAFRRCIFAVREKSGSGYSTLMFGAGSCELSQCAKYTAELRHSLDRTIVPGLSRTAQMNDASPHPGQDTKATPDAELESRIDFLLSNASWHGLEAVLGELAAAWEREQRPLVWVEGILRQVLLRVLRKSGNPKEMTAEDVELLLDDLLSGASSFSNLEQGAWEIVQSIAGPGCDVRRQTDVPSFYAAIVRYVEQNYADPLTLRSVCQRFSVSQTYVSRLFRRYEHMSFIDFLTKTRVDTAKRFITENPGMPLKDVAAYVGYKDQFYFSRVFKAVTGIPPSEWGKKPAATER
jgi:two-component system response regulator YesN